MPIGHQNLQKSRYRLFWDTQVAFFSIYMVTTLMLFFFPVFVCMPKIIVFSYPVRFHYNKVQLYNFHNNNAAPTVLHCIVHIACSDGFSIVLSVSKGHSAPPIRSTVTHTPEMRHFWAGACSDDRPAHLAALCCHYLCSLLHCWYFA